MATHKQNNNEEWRILKRIVFVILIICFMGFYLVWRIDSPRVENIRLKLADRVLPHTEFIIAPMRFLSDVILHFQSYSRLYDQNIELRDELKRMKSWKEAAIQLEQENARLAGLNNIRLDPELTFITARILADSGSQFRQSRLLNIGRSDGVTDGWAAMDGLGLVGRISGVGDHTSRLLFINDSSSQVPAIIQPSGQRTIIKGDNSVAPPLEFVEFPDQIQPGDQVVTSGDGKVFPADLNIGLVVKDPDGRLRVRLAADLNRLEFVRVLRYNPSETVERSSKLIGVKPLSDIDFIGPRLAPKEAQ